MYNFQKVLLEGLCALLPFLLSASWKVDMMAGAWMASWSMRGSWNGNPAWQSNEIEGIWALTHQHTVLLDLLTVREKQAFLLQLNSWLLTTHHLDKKSYKVVYFISQANATCLLEFFMQLSWSAERQNKTDMGKEPCRKIGDRGALWKMG